jgi:hypothetical protein
MNANQEQAEAEQKLLIKERGQARLPDPETPKLNAFCRMRMAFNLESQHDVW